jgi:hypothetical protein
LMRMMRFVLSRAGLYVVSPSRARRVGCADHPLQLAVGTAHPTFIGQSLLDEMTSVSRVGEGATGGFIRQCKPCLTMSSS